MDLFITMLITFFYIYSLAPGFANGLGAYVFPIIVLGLGLIVFFKEAIEKIPYRIFLILLFCWVGWFIFSSMLNQNFDPIPIRMVLGFIARVLTAVYLIILFNFFKREPLKSHFLAIIAYCGIAQSLLAIFFFHFPDFLVFSHSFFYTDFFKKFAVTSSMGIRGYGLAISTGGFLSAVQGMILTIIIFLFINKEWKWPKALTCYTLVLPSIVLTGRSGYLGIALSLVYLFGYGIINLAGKIKASFRSLSLGIALIAIIFIGVTLMFNKTSFSAQAFEFLHNLNRDQNVSFIKSTRTTDYLFSRMYFPVSGKTLLFGDGRYIENGSSYRLTDAGYMRQILLYGIPGLLILVIGYLTPFLYLFLKKRLDNLPLSLLFFLLLNIFILEIKDDVMLGSFVNKLYFLTIAYFLSVKSLNLTPHHP